MEQNYYIVTGYNCGWNVEKCIDSIYSVDKKAKILAMSDGSTDDTVEKLFKLRKKYNNLLIFFRRTNLGPAASRYYLLNNLDNEFNIRSRDRIILVDMDDYLLNLPFFKESELTIGSTQCASGKRLVPAYTEDELTGNIWESSWKAFPLRSFTWGLWKRVNLDEDWFKFEDGNWIKVCTDVALMFPLMMQAKSIRQTKLISYYYNDIGDHVGRSKYELKLWEQTNELIVNRMKTRYE